MRTCSKCLTLKPIAEFSKLSRSKDGLHTQCKKCVNESQNRWRKKKQVVYRGNCAWCSKPFQSSIPTRKYCNRNCAALSRRSDPKYKQKEYDRATVRRRQTSPQRRAEYSNTRREAMLRVGRGVLACSKCGCTEQSILEINHIYGAEKTLSHGRSGKYRKEPLSSFLKRIRDGIRSIDDLNLMCKPCNNWYEVMRKYPEIASDYTIKWEPQNLWKPTSNDFDSRLLVPSYSNMASRDEVSIDSLFTNRFELNIPIVSSPMSCVTEFKLAKAMHQSGGGFVLHRYMPSDEQADMVRALKNENVKPIAVSISTNDYERVRKLVDAGADVLVIDISHGDSKPAYDTLKSIRKDWGDEVDVMSGNIVTAEAASRYYSAEANALRVGIGIGSVCTTRAVSGAGKNQILSIEDVHRAVPSLPICSDGGIRSGHDVVKALAAGASTVMVGSLLAPTKESPAERTVYASRTYVKYFGMASVEAMEKRIERTKEDSSGLIHIKAPEGKSSLIPCNNESVSDVLKRVVTDVKIGLAYIGARNIDEARKNADWGVV